MRMLERRKQRGGKRRKKYRERSGWSYIKDWKMKRKRDEKEDKTEVEETRSKGESEEKTLIRGSITRERDSETTLYQRR